MPTTITYTTFSAQFPELAANTAFPSLATFNAFLPAWLLEIGSLKNDICITPDLLELIPGLTAEDVYDQIRSLWIAHTIVMNNQANYPNEVDQNIKRVESLDNQMEWFDKKVKSSFDFNLTKYGKRYLDMMERYSCTRQAEVARNSLHEISGFALEIDASCGDGYFDSHYTNFHNNGEVLW